MRKNTYSTLIAYLRVAKRKKKCKFFVTFFFCSTTFHKKTQSLPSSSHSPFFVFLPKPFFLSFPRSSSSAFTGRAKRARPPIRTQPCALARSSLPSPGHALRIRSVGTIFGLDQHESFFACWEIHFSRFFLFFYVGGIITPGVMQIVREKKYHHT